MKAVLIGACLLTLASIVARPAEAEEADDPANEKLKVGDEAPDFAFPDPENPDKTVKLSELKGKKNVVLAFYPKAFTGGCTKQLCGYRDDFSKFEAADTMVVAVSADDQDESTRFKKEHKMPFSVLGDREHKVIDAYGIPMKGEYAQRSIVIVGKDGKVRYIDMEYRIDEDEEPLFQAIAQLKKDDSGSETG